MIFAGQTNVSITSLSGNDLMPAFNTFFARLT